MTHGAGAMSRGGRGYSGGDGFGDRAGFSTPVYDGGRRGRRTDDCDNGAGCCFLCIVVGYLVAFLLCLTKMKPRTRVALVWFYCILGGGLGGVLLLQRYQTQVITASQLDQRKVTVMSSVFSESLSIISTVAIPSYLFDKEPVVNTSAYVNNDYTKTTTRIFEDDYDYWGYFLLRASKVTVIVSNNEVEITFYIIKNKHNLNKWLGDTHCDDCYEEVYTFFPRDSPDDYSEYYYTASDSDDYFFVLANNDVYFTDVDIQFELTRTRYDLSDCSLICNNETDCKIPLALSTQYVVFDVPRFSPRDVDVTITYDRRVYVFVMLFGLLPFMVGVFITLVIIKHGRRKELITRNRTDSQVFSITVSDREAIESSFSNPAAQLPPAPPEYAKHPPSYEQLYGTQ